MATETAGGNPERILGWLELAVLSRRHDGIAVLHAVDRGNAQPCCGVTVDQRWLCGNDGAMTFFDSLASATRFLSLLNVPRIATGGSRDSNWVGQDHFQCFQLGAKGFLPCTKHCVVETTRSNQSRQFAD